VGMEKKAYLEEQYPGRDMQVMVRIRQAVDTSELANRGKMLPAIGDAVGVHA
jgi:FAD/FMN-containing dehydrogenase